ncbi:unnamed protein product [Penicillium olsonii]|nr:unnamed protein product [Penicillium olsonii]CAG7930826.1 unnamed protein product [Penicillium olsonii]
MPLLCSQVPRDAMRTILGFELDNERRTGQEKRKVANVSGRPKVWGSPIRGCVSRIINTPLPQSGMPRVAGIARGKPSFPVVTCARRHRRLRFIGRGGRALTGVTFPLHHWSASDILNMAGSLIQRHPLQRLASPSRSLSALVHLVGLSSFFWAFKYNEAYGWHFQYLTVIGLTLSTLTFLVGLSADITLSRRLFLVKNILSVCSTPLEVLISVLYWGLRLIDEKLVIPENVIIPLHADLAFHATPSVVMMIDLLFLSPPWTITIVPALMISVTIAFGYWFWVEQCFAANGWYPYPIFEVLSIKGRIGLFTLSAVIMALSTVTLKWLVGRINGFGHPMKLESRPGDIKRKQGL